MDAAPSEFVAHCLELLAGAGRPRAKRMFGGHGLYIDELFVAIVGSERLYLKVDAQTRGRFETAGCLPFAYQAQGKPHTMAYFSAPDEAMESPMLMQPWARLALEAALRARAAKPASAKRKAATQADAGKL